MTHAIEGDTNRAQKRAMGQRGNGRHRMSKWRRKAVGAAGYDQRRYDSLWRLYQRYNKKGLDQIAKRIDLPNRTKLPKEELRAAIINHMFTMNGNGDNNE